MGLRSWSPNGRRKTWPIDCRAGRGPKMAPGGLTFPGRPPVANDPSTAGGEQTRTGHARDARARERLPAAPTGEMRPCAHPRPAALPAD
eukprot:1333610-Pyramimonas_sp.AAC.1